MTRKLLLYSSILIFGLLSSCFTEDIKKEVAKSFVDMQKMTAQGDFTKAIAYVEVHKLRHGIYPASLNDLEYISIWDSSLFSTVQYERLEIGYELNLTQRYTSFNGDTGKVVQIDYPDDFWIGIGCVKSNLKK